MMDECELRRLRDLDKIKLAATMDPDAEVELVRRIELISWVLQDD
jgi:hypothetical protein